MEMIVILSALHMQRSLIVTVGLPRSFCISLFMYRYTDSYHVDHDFNLF